jgi:hypothetical protein
MLQPKATQGPMPPQGRMAFSALLGLFFAAFAFGSLHTAKQEYRWRNASEVHGVLVRSGSGDHYEYRPRGAPAVLGPRLPDQFSNEPDGVIDDWVPLDYDPAVPEHLRKHLSKGRAATNYRQFLITAGAGAAFSFAVFVCIAVFLRANQERRTVVES